MIHLGKSNERVAYSERVGYKLRVLDDKIFLSNKQGIRLSTKNLTPYLRNKESFEDRRQKIFRCADSSKNDKQFANCLNKFMTIEWTSNE